MCDALLLVHPQSAARQAACAGGNRTQCSALRWFKRINKSVMAITFHASKNRYERVGGECG